MIALLCEWVGGSSRGRLDGSGRFVGESGVRDEGRGGRGGDGEVVAAFVFAMTVVAAEPFPGDAVAVGGGFEALPEVAVFDGLTIGGLPAAGFPVADPALVHGVDDVAGIGEELDLAGFGEGFEGDDGGEEFHAVVGGAEEALGEFESVLAADHDDAVAAGAWIASAGAIGVDGDGFHGWCVEWGGGVGRKLG